MADGRAKSSAFQKADDDKSKTLVQPNEEIQAKNKEKIETNNKNKGKYEQYLQMRRDEFKKDSEGVWRDSDGMGVSERYKVDKDASQRDRLEAGQ